MDSILIKQSIIGIELLHRQILQRVHHMGRIRKVHSQRLPSRVLLEVTVIVYSTFGIGIDVTGPHFPFDK